MAGTVFNMLRNVLQDTEAKLAEEEQSRVKTASAQVSVVPKVEPQHDDQDPEKVASACEWLAEHLTDVVDNRSPQEKLAEVMAIHEAIKQAEGMADEGKDSHQTTKAEASSIPPMNPSLGSGVPGAGDNAMQAGPNTATGTGIEADGGGKANPDNTPPMKVDPNEKANPQDAANALETNRNDPPGGGSEAPEKIAARARTLTKMASSGLLRPEVAAFMITKDQQKLAAAKQKVAAGKSMPPAKKPPTKTSAAISKLKKAAADSGIPEAWALATMRTKLGEDAINPAQISASTDPILQSAPGVPPAQSQGAEAGQLTPDTRGGDPGRDLISSVESAINATKGQAKNVKSEMAAYLNEPAQASAHDSVLQQSLDNTSSAGVKIASTRALLEKWAQQSPENQRAVQEAIARVKQANASMGYDATSAVPGAAAGGAAQGGAMAGGMAGLAAPGTAGSMGTPGGGAGKTANADVAGASEAPSPEALEAARAGVTAEELAAAEMLLAAASQEGAQQPPPEGSGPPPAEPSPSPMGPA